VTAAVATAVATATAAVAVARTICAYASNRAKLIVFILSPRSKCENGTGLPDRRRNLVKFLAWTQQNPSLIQSNQNKFGDKTSK